MTTQSSRLNQLGRQSYKSILNNVTTSDFEVFSLRYSDFENDWFTHTLEYFGSGFEILKN